ncbi:unnamed protein product [Polarella glacialis]|uniref:Uncharacterized protein n=1 Tax=Polarella glacialis TaxID=89957 RepID=A0A813EXU2_POLGL|nr:unnamed protein product [Polarella glacialis]
MVEFHFEPSFDIWDYNSHIWGNVKLCRPSIAPLGTWYQNFVDSDLHQAACSGIAFNGIFAASADRIRRWLLRSYEALCEELVRCGANRSVADHYMERAWKPMLDNDGFLGESAFAGDFSCPIRRLIVEHCRATKPGLKPDCGEIYRTIREKSESWIVMGMVDKYEHHRTPSDSCLRTWTVTELLTVVYACSAHGGLGAEG